MGCGADGGVGPGKLICVAGEANCEPADVAGSLDVAVLPDAGDSAVAPSDIQDTAETIVDDASADVDDPTDAIVETDVRDDPDVDTGECPAGTSELCYENIGECRTGKRLRIDGAWGECRGGQGPTDEVCDGLDNDCNGTDDDRTPACECTDGGIETCGSTDVGACELGSRLCVSGAWGPCQGNVEPTTHLCTNDDLDCNNAPDHTQAPCVCRDGDTEGCGSAEGVCEEGSRSCANGAWSPCLGSVGPRTVNPSEGAAGLCNGEDDNCDGVADEGCGCQPPAVQTCGTDTGACSAGTQTCLTDGTWGACAGGVQPTNRLCDNADRDCNGAADYLQPPCQCLNGAARACGTNTGECVAGNETCTSGAWGICAGQVSERSELCNNKDDDCDGTTDEGLNPPTARACWVDQTGALICADPNTSAVPPLATVNLDGRQSSDPDGLALSYAWRIASAPAGSTATITNPNSARPSLYAQLAGAYRVCLVVTDTSLCLSSEACVSIAVVPSSRVHIQLTWDKDNADMDLHFMEASIANFFDYGSNGANANCDRAKDCFYICTQPRWGGDGAADNPRLDIDNTFGFGPENVNLDAPYSQTFPIAVHFWCDKHGPAYDTGANVGASVATVRLYIDGLLKQTWTRSMTRRQRWYVADLVWNTNNNPPWTLTARDTLATTNAPLGCPDP